MAGKVILTVPQPVVPTIKLKVLQDLRIGDAFYTTDHIVEVFHHEAVKLLTDYPEHFEISEI